MKNAFTALAFVLALSAPAAANISNAFHENMSFPTNFDGFMSDKAKQTAKKKN